MKALVRLMTVPVGKRDMPWVHEGLRAAIQLELSTIPPYLYAAWSIDQNADPSGCRQVITEIAKEEMLHMGIACNLLTAVGGHPDIVGAASAYPTQLPTHVHKGLVVGLAPLSPAVLLDTFMAIEEPSAHLVDDPDFTPSGATLIGQFYDELYAALAAAAPAFTTAGQVDLTPHFPTAPPLIAKLQDASDAIDLIKRQGEGTAAMPFKAPLISASSRTSTSSARFSMGIGLPGLARSPTPGTPSPSPPCTPSNRPRRQHPARPHSTRPTAICSGACRASGTATHQARRHHRRDVRA